VFTVLREADSAVTALEPVPSLEPVFFSRAILRVDPTWAPLRASPRFERLVAQPEAALKKASANKPSL
jgi:hypothetical protein